MDNKCKLCQALKEGDFAVPANLHPELLNSFSRDSEICDACLATDADLDTPRFIFLKAAVVAGLLVAIMLSVFTVASIICFDAIDGPPRLIISVQQVLFMLLTCFVAGVLLCSLIIYSHFCRKIRKLERDQKQNNPQLFQQETQRLKWMSRWAEVKGNKKQSKKLQRMVERRNGH